MNLHRLETSPPEWLGIALEEFEREFSYPLGERASFHVVHGRQYVAFFQAMGEAIVFVAERDGRVLGTVAVILRRLRSPKGKKTPVYYVCDLKVTRGRAGGPVLARLMHAVRDHVLRTGLAPVYGIVMDGTARLPTQYTGRVDIPRFEPMAQLAVLKISTEVNDAWALACESASRDTVDHLREYLNLGAWSSSACSSELRSEMTALPLMSQCADGCGVLEDTRLGKRLMMHDGTEMKAAHLSWLGCGKPIAAMAVIQSARAIARQQGFPSLFVSLPNTESFAGLIRSLVRRHGALLAPATVYGTGFPMKDGAEWWVNTSEI
jgi:hypothetical protein